MKKIFVKTDNRYADSCIQALSEERIVSFELDGNGVIVEEMCDGYFRAKLNKSALVALIGELNAMADKLTYDTVDPIIDESVDTA